MTVRILTAMALAATALAPGRIGDIGEPTAEEILLPPPVSAEFDAEYSAAATTEIREDEYDDMSTTGPGGTWEVEEVTAYVYLTDRTAEEVARAFEEAFPESQLDISADGWSTEITLESDPLMGPPPDELERSMKEMYAAQGMEWGDEHDEQMARYREVYPRLKDVVQTTGSFLVQDYFSERPESYREVDVVIERPFVNFETVEVVDRTAIRYHVYVMRLQG